MKKRSKPGLVVVCDSVRIDSRRSFTFVVGCWMLSALIRQGQSFVLSHTQSKRSQYAVSTARNMVLSQQDGGSPTVDQPDPVAHKDASLLSKTNGIQARAKVVSTNDLEACGERLRAGKLVAFPTETVYGLGCHALDETAVRSVFAAKERPSTDPLIVHVLQASEAYQLWEASSSNIPSDESKILSTLCSAFWPGPLTIVARANRSIVPDCVMANTGFVACRSPSHPTARALIEAARVPLAAPSANKFGHVSPTTAQHVWDDLHDEDVWIVNETHRCHVGVESTVAKLDRVPDESDSHNYSTKQSGKQNYRLTVLRQGAVSADELCASLDGLQNVVVESKLHRATQEDVANVAPGQTIRHYSPNVPSYLVSKACVPNHVGNDNMKVYATARSKLSEAVIIDYGERLKAWKGLALAYRDLSSASNSSEAAQGVFETLRWAEQVPGAKRILFPQLHDKNLDALALAVKDRLTRAASGVVIDSLDQT